MTLRRTLLATGIALAAALGTPLAGAQTKPIHLIVPYAAGGPLDVTARALAVRNGLAGRSARCWKNIAG